MNTNIFIGASVVLILGTVFHKAIYQFFRQLLCSHPGWDEIETDKNGIGHDVTPHYSISKCKNCGKEKRDDWCS